MWVLLVAATCVVALHKSSLYTASAQYYVTLPATAGQIDPVNGLGSNSVGTQDINDNSTSAGLPQSQSSDADKIKATQDFVKSQLPMLSTLVTTNVVLEPVIKQYAPNVSLTTLKARTKLYTQDDTVLVTIQVQDENPSLAATLANAVGESLNTALAGNSFAVTPLSQGVGSSGGCNTRLLLKGCGFCGVHMVVFDPV